jgi:hypothetical protein
VNSRAVLRVVEPGQTTKCTACAQPVKWSAKGNRRQRRVIANVYEHGRWDRVEIFHPACYSDLGEPYGPAMAGQRTVSTPG